MSHTVLIEESNGNGLFAVKSSTSTSGVLASSLSNEDLSQSLSEYTDADESMSAPTEFLAEFLSAVMLKDYKKALKYCKLILHYEPNNATARDFYPLIQEKLKFDSSSESDENYNKSSSPDVEIDRETVGEDHSAAESDNLSEGPGSYNLSSNDDRTGSRGGANSYNSSHGGDASDSEDADASTSESDENNLVASNSNASTSHASHSDNTTHSYSSLLLEEDDEPQAMPPAKDMSMPDLDLSNGNVKSTSCSDSESPTEPLTQRLVAILRSKCVPGKTT